MLLLPLFYTHYYSGIDGAVKAADSLREALGIVSSEVNRSLNLSSQIAAKNDAKIDNIPMDYLSYFYISACRLCKTKLRISPQYIKSKVVPLFKEVYVREDIAKPDGILMPFCLSDWSEGIDFFVVRPAFSVSRAERLNVTALNDLSIKMNSILYIFFCLSLATWIDFLKLVKTGKIDMVKKGINYSEVSFQKLFERVIKKKQFLKSTYMTAEEISINVDGTEKYLTSTIDMLEILENNASDIKDVIENISTQSIVKNILTLQKIVRV